MHEIKSEFIEAQRILNEFLADDSNFELISAAGSLMVRSLAAGGKILSCGNGGSMCDAIHFAEELTGRFRDDRPPVAAISISDPSHITCTANDYGFDHIFSRFIEGVGNPGDVLLAISTSGNSANIINAADAANDKGMKVVALTGGDGGKLANKCDIEIRAPRSTFSDRTQEIHIKIIHALILFIEKSL
jgi:D-sedoheptulose 7-phosphate isomerase